MTPSDKIFEDKLYTYRLFALDLTFTDFQMGRQKLEIYLENKVFQKKDFCRKLSLKTERFRLKLRHIMLLVQACVGI